MRSQIQVRDTNGRELELSAWGWPSRDRFEAESRARGRLAHLRSRVEQGLELGHGYAYAERPLREEITEELCGPRDEVGGVGSADAEKLMTQLDADRDFVRPILRTHDR